MKLSPVCLALAAFLFAGAASAATPQSGSTRHLASLDAEALALPFLPNQGQMDARVAFYAPLFTGTVYVTRDGEIVYSLPAKSAAKGDVPAAADRATQQGWVLTERLITSSPLAPKAGEAGSAHVNYFIGRDPARWRHDLPTSGSISLGKPWPGIEVSLAAHANNVESFYRLSAGADVKHIRLKLSGAKALKIKDGQLLAETGLGSVAFESPKAWQTIGGERRNVPVRYVLHHGAYGFKLGAHDRTAPVVIDPDFQATYLGGGNSGDSARVLCMAIDAFGDVYVAGQTSSTDFPGTAGGAQASYPGKTFETSFVAKLDPGLTTLEQASFLGGTNVSVEDEYALGIAIDSSGDVYVAGRTSSADFPGTAGGAQASLAGFENGYIAKLSSDLKTLDQATYLGGGNDGIQAIALDAAGDVYVTGFTQSTNFPGVSGGYQTALTASTAAFVAKLNSGLTVLDQATYLGGSGGGSAAALAIDSTGDVYVAGESSTDFPGTTGGAQPADAGASNGNGFIAKLSADLTTLDQATYLGGSGSSSYGDEITSIALDSTGDVYVSGRTFSTDFPATSGGAQPATAAPSGDYSNGFVAKLNASLASIEQATYIGGNSAGSFDDAFALALDPAGDVYVSGMTSASEFPGAAGSAVPASGFNDGYVAKLNPDLTVLEQATFLGGSESESIAIGPAGDVYATGYVFSGSYPGTSGGAQSAFGAAGSLAYIVRFPADLKAQTRLDISFGGGSTLWALGGVDDISVIVTNNSTDTGTTGIQFTVTLPSSLSWQSTTPPEDGSCGVDGQVITCQYNGGLAALTGLTFHIGVKAGTSGPAAVFGNIVHADQDLTASSITTSELVVDVGPFDTTANGGSVNTHVDQAVSGNLSSDNPCGCGTPIYRIDTAPSHGKVSFTDSSNGKFTYTPVAGYVGSDSFTFELVNHVGSPTAATEQVTVSDPASTANDGSVNTAVGVAVTGMLSATAAYTGQMQIFSLVSNPAHGTVTLNAGSGQFRYVPGTGYAGTDGFTFKVRDAYGAVSNIATESVTVTDIAAKADNATIAVFGKRLTFSGHLGATKAYAGQVLGFAVVSPPAHGSVTITNAQTGAYTYTAEALYKGMDSFTFQAVDQWGTASNAATVSVKVF